MPADQTNRPSPAARRTVLAGLLATALPALGRAQVPVTPQIVNPVQPAAPLPAPASPPRPVLPPPVIDKTKIYFVFFDQAIDINSMRALRRQLTALVEAGVTEIDLVINSSGGLISQALITYSFMRSLPATVNTHAQGLVASAANVLFLAGAGRSADRTARFLFHASTFSLVGSLNEQQIQEQLTQVSTVEEILAQIYQDRTRLTENDVRDFKHREIIYTAQDALRLGIVQTVADLAIPGDQKAKILFVE